MWTASGFSQQTRLGPAAGGGGEAAARHSRRTRRSSADMLAERQDWCAPGARRPRAWCSTHPSRRRSARCWTRAGFYGEWKGKFGTEAGALLEKNAAATLDERRGGATPPARIRGPASTCSWSGASMPCARAIGRGAGSRAGAGRHPVLLAGVIARFALQPAAGLRRTRWRRCCSCGCSATLRRGARRQRRAAHEHARRRPRPA